MFRWPDLTMFLSFVLTSWTSPLVASDSAPPSFRRNVAPLLNARCVRCHGEKVRKANLDLRSAAGVLKGGESGAVVVAGKPDKSLLYERVHKGEMPPEEGKRLREAEVEMIRRWIADGAKIELSDGSQSAISQYDVIPIMLRRCTACHGLHRQENGLDLRSKATMVRGGKSGPAIVPGKPADSLLIKKIAAGQMPPPTRLVEACVKPVEQAELDTLTRWIAAGAPEIAIEPDVATTKPDPLVTDKDRDFWAFRPPQPVKVPAVRESAHGPQSDRQLRAPKTGVQGTDPFTRGGPRGTDAAGVL